jgi:hypothetical protein
VLGAKWQKQRFKSMKIYILRKALKSAQSQSSKSYRNQPLSAFSFRLSALMQRRRLDFFSGIGG